MRFNGQLETCQRMISSYQELVKRGRGLQPNRPVTRGQSVIEERTDQFSDGDVLTVVAYPA